MRTEVLRALALCETDVDGALRRFAGDEDLYLSYLKMFLAEPTMADLNKSIEARDWDAAFIATHALKGLAGNLGFVPYFHSLGVLVLLLRDKKIDEIDVAYTHVRNCYDDVINAIRECCGDEQ